MKTHDPTTEPLVYSADEVAAKLGVSRDAVFGAVKRGEMPGFRIGRLVRVPKWAVDRLLEPAA